MTAEIMRRLIETGEVERLRIALARDVDDARLVEGLSDRSVVINAWARGLHQ